MKTKNYYQVLGISPFTTQVEIKKAYAQRLLEAHPDTGSTKFRDLTQRFHDIKEAYEALRTPERRATYDRMLTIDITTGARAARFIKPALNDNKPKRSLNLFDFLFQTLKTKI